MESAEQRYRSLLNDSSVGPGQEQFIKKLEADKTINYKEQKLQSLSDQYDILFDLTTKVRFSAIRDLLNPKGVFIPANPFNHLSSLFKNLFRKQKVGFLMVVREDHAKFSKITKWVEEGKLIPIIDSSYSLKDYQKGFDRLFEEGKRGRIIIKIEED